MGVITKNYQTSNILVGPADTYIGIAAPPSATPPGAAQFLSINSSGQPPTASSTITGATNATPIVVTATNFAAGYVPQKGDIWTISGVGGNTNANGTWTISNVSIGASTTATLVGSAGNAAYTSGGTIIVGQHLGLTEGPVKFTITPKFDEIRADQFESPIDTALTTVEAELDIVIMEYNPLTVQRWFTADNVTNPQSLGSYSSVLQFGGQFNTSATLRNMLFISPDRVNLGLFTYVLAYRTYLKSAVQLTFHRTAANKFSIKVGCVADFTRQLGDALLSIVRQRLV